MVIPPNIWQDNMLTGSTPFLYQPAASILLERAACDGFTIAHQCCRLPTI